MIKTNWHRLINIYHKIVQDWISWCGFSGRLRLIPSFPLGSVQVAANVQGSKDAALRTLRWSLDGNKPRFIHRKWDRGSGKGPQFIHVQKGWMRGIIIFRTRCPPDFEKLSTRNLSDLRDTVCISYIWSYHINMPRDTHYYWLWNPFMLDVSMSTHQHHIHIVLRHPEMFKGSRLGAAGTGVWKCFVVSPFFLPTIHETLVVIVSSLDWFWKCFFPPTTCYVNEKMMSHQGDLELRFVFRQNP